MKVGDLLTVKIAFTFVALDEIWHSRSTQVGHVWLIVGHENSWTYFFAEGTFVKFPSEVCPLDVYFNPV